MCGTGEDQPQAKFVSFPFMWLLSAVAGKNLYFNKLSSENHFLL
jgi:hypothetical protein